MSSFLTIVKNLKPSHYSRPVNIGRSDCTFVADDHFVFDLVRNMGTAEIWKR
jgi:hypothetical protein